MLCLGGVRRARHMVLTLDTFAEVLRGLKDLPTSSHGHLLYILERGTLNENENPYSLRAIADFLVGVDEYVDGAADLAEELAAFAREAGVKRSTKGGTNVARKKATAEEEEELDEEELEAENKTEDDCTPRADGGENKDEDEDGEEGVYDQAFGEGRPLPRGRRDGGALDAHSLVHEEQEERSEGQER